MYWNVAVLHLQLGDSISAHKHFSTVAAGQGEVYAKDASMLLESFERFGSKR